MSKAFKSEDSTDPGTPSRPPPRLAPGEVRYVTPEGQAELRRALADLRVERDKASLSPEPLARGRLSDLEARVALAEATLASLTVLGPESAREGEVAFGTWVTVEDASHAQVTWRIVGPDEADAKRGRLSALSPVGRALLGRSVGESVEVERPGGPVELRVVRVKRSLG